MSVRDALEIVGLGWLALLARHGIVANAIRALDPAGQSPELLHGRGAVLMAMVHTLMPLAVLTMLPVMLQIDRTLQKLRRAGKIKWERRGPSIVWVRV